MKNIVIHWIAYGFYLISIRILIQTNQIFEQNYGYGISQYLFNLNLQIFSLSIQI